VDLVRSADVPVLVDSDGEQLARAARRCPALVKVNAAEAAAATGADPEQPWAAAHALQGMGAGTVVVTLGAEGSLGLAEDGRRFEVHHEPLERALPVGSGDAFLAGLAARYLANGSTGTHLAARTSLDDALLHAAAAGRANARHLEAGSCTLAALLAELPAITVRTL